MTAHPGPRRAASTPSVRCRAARSAAARLAACALPLLSLGPAPPAAAQLVQKLGDDASISLGLGLRMNFSSVQNGAPNGTSSSKDFSVTDTNIHTTGRFGKHIETSLNFDRGPGTDSTLRLHEAIVKLGLGDDFNLWAGRMLPPMDRSSLYGGFFSSNYNPPFIAGNYPRIDFGRDNGVALWGTPLGARLNWSVGVYEGHNRAPGLSNAGENLLVAGRLQWNVWDPEGGYNRPSSYLGEKNLLSFAVAGQRQKDGVGTASKPGTLSIWSVEGLYEQKLPGGYVPTLEATYWRYDLGGSVDCGSGEPGSAVCPAGFKNVGGQVAGKSFFVTGLLLFPQKVGWGQFQPFVRYQRYDRSVSGTRITATDLGLNYLIKGFDLKFSAVYTRTNDSRVPLQTAGAPAATSQFLLGAQLQW